MDCTAGVTPVSPRSAYNLPLVTHHQPSHLIQLNGRVCLHVLIVFVDLSLVVKHYIPT